MLRANNARTREALKGCPVAETKSTQSNPARAGSNREQARRGSAVGAGSGGRGRGSTVTTGANPPRAPLPALAGAGGRRGRGNPLDFIRDVRSELRKAAWASQRG